MSWGKSWSSCPGRCLGKCPRQCRCFLRCVGVGWRWRVRARRGWRPGLCPRRACNGRARVGFRCKGW